MQLYCVVCQFPTVRSFHKRQNSEADHKFKCFLCQTRVTRTISKLTQINTLQTF